LLSLRRQRVTTHGAGDSEGSGVSATALIDDISTLDGGPGIGTWCCDLELSGDAAPRPVVPPTGAQTFVRVLVRLHGEPLGYVTWLLADGNLDLAALLRVAWARYQERINDHLLREGLAPLDELMPYARAPAASGTCPNRVVSDELVSVVVCTRNRSAILADCLTRLRLLTYPHVEVIVVDNAPLDDSTRSVVDNVSATDQRFRYVVEPRPGLSCARNRGLAEARGAYVAYTDDDVSVDPGWIEGLLRGFQRRDDVGCVTGLVCTAGITSEAEAYFDARAAAWSTRLEAQVFDRRQQSDADPLYPYAGSTFGTGANFAFDRAVLLDLGGFDESLGAGTLTRGGEDLDIFVRVLAATRAVAYEPAAVVWHHHRADRAALLSQMFGYGTGLSAFATKCLVQRSTRWDVLRRVPAGLRRVCRIAGQTGERLEGRAEPPKGVRRRELAGWVAGPVLYVRARGAVKRRPRREPVPETATARLVISLTSLACFVIGAMALAVGAEMVRTVCLLIFSLIGIGSAPWQANPALRLPARLTLTMLTSLSVLTLVSVPMLALQQWRPMTAFVAVAAVCIPMQLAGLRLALRDSELPRLRSAPGGPTAAPGIGAVSRLLRSPSVLLATAGGLLSLNAALAHGHLVPGFFGFLPRIGAGWYVGLALVLVALAMSRPREEREIVVPVLLLLVVLTLTPALVFDGPRSQSAAKHVDLVMQIRSVHRLDATVEIYNSWNGFFAAMAWLCDIAGIRDPMNLATFWPPLLGVFRIAALRYLFGQILHRPHQAWVAVALAVLADPLGADYFSPQSVGFVIGIAVFGLALSAGEGLPRLRLIFLAGCLLAVTHQLSPYSIGGILFVLVVFRQIRPVWTPMLVLGPALFWAAVNRGALKGFLSWESIGSFQNFRPPKTVGSSGLERLPVVGQSVRALVLEIAIIAGFALLALLRHRREPRAWALACCPAVGLVLVAVNPYGQEGIFRAMLFGMPWLALLAAHCFASPRQIGRLIAARLVLLVVTAVLAAAHLVAAFGLDAVHVIRPGDVAAFRYFEKQRTDRTGRHYLLALGTGDLPSSLPTQPGLYRTIRRERLNEPVRQEPLLRPDPQMQMLTTRFLDFSRRDSGRTTTTLYALWSPVSSDHGWAYGIQSPDQFAALRDAFRRSSYWEVVLEHDGTYLFRFDSTHYDEGKS
jgi:GT2 family glycosyltransferase